MKKIFLIGLLALTAACQTATSTLAPESTPTAPPQTPTMPATVPPAPTFTPTSLPTPVPQYLTDEFDSTLGVWSSLLTSGETTPQICFENGSLQLAFSSPHTWFYAIHNAHDYETVHLDAKFNSSGSQPVTTGLICNYSEANGWLEYNFSTDGTYNILRGQWVATGIAQYLPVINDGSEYLTPERTDYEIGITCEPKTLWLYINGKLFRKLDISHFELTGGKVGIAAAVFENVPVTAYFEWFKVSKPTE